MAECYTPDGCCGPLDLSLAEFLCQSRQLLPPSQMWSNFKTGSNEALVDSVLTSVYKALEYINAVAKELDPCTAEYTVEKWAERYGISIQCDEPLPYIASNMNPQQRNLVLSMLICLREKMQYIGVFNLAAVQSVAKMFGVKVRVFQPGWVVAPDEERCQFQCGPVPFVDCEPHTHVVNECTRNYPLVVKQPEDSPFYTTIEYDACSQAKGSNMYTDTDCPKDPPVLIIRMCPDDAPEEELNCYNWVSYDSTKVEDTYVPLTTCSPICAPLIGRPLMDSFVCFIRNAFPPHYRVCIEVLSCGQCEPGTC